MKNSTSLQNLPAGHQISGKNVKCRICGYNHGRDFFLGRRCIKCGNLLIANAGIKNFIIIDTREQRPLWPATYPNVLFLPLREGDYTTSDLINVAHVERKSPEDLYGSLIQGHRRFRDEILRANNKNIKLAIFVECELEYFLGKKWPGGYMRKAPGATLKKIITTFSDKYNINFVWCRDRDTFRENMLLWFERQRQLFKRR